MSREKLAVAVREASKAVRESGLLTSEQALTVLTEMREISTTAADAGSHTRELCAKRNTMFVETVLAAARGDSTVEFLVAFEQLCALDALEGRSYESDLRLSSALHGPAR